MACNKCGHTKSSPCACKDHGLTTPCSYTDCSPISDGKRSHPEHCDEIICTDCIARCRNTFQISNDANQTLYAYAGDKLDTILQRMFIFATTPSCFNTSIAHIWHDDSATTSTTVTINWDSVPAGQTAINVEYATENGAFVQDNAVALPYPGNITYTVGNVTPLLPNTVYRFRLKTETCYSVELLVRTLNE
tara:strand:+ start:264 stop:836 length:573 start_codon:yes stop_codon:yes gene_type:complete